MQSWFVQATLVYVTRTLNPEIQIQDLPVLNSDFYQRYNHRQLRIYDFNPQESQPLEFSFFICLYELSDTVLIKITSAAFCFSPGKG